jgi:prophage DNA circulation protein
MHSRTAVLAFVLSLALVAAGCGGSDEDDDPTAAWASGFCTAVTDWTDSLQDVISQFNDTSNLSEDGLRSAAGDVRSATDEFADDLRGLGAPETESGDEIQSALDAASTTFDQEAASIEEAAEGVSNLTELPGAITAITTSLSAMGTAASTLFQTLQDADVEGELQSALEDSPECAGISSR